MPLTPIHTFRAQRRGQELAHIGQQPGDIVVRLKPSGHDCPERSIVGTMEDDGVDEPTDIPPQRGIKERGRDPQRDPHSHLARIRLHELSERR